MLISYHMAESYGPANTMFEGFRAVDVSMERIANCVSKLVWSPCVWQGGRRLKGNFTGADLCVLDFDSGELTLDGALKTFAEYRHVIGTTKSHGIEKGGVVCDRFRVVLQFDKRLTSARHYEFEMKRMLRAFPADVACKDAARFFYPCTTVVAIRNEGKTITAIEESAIPPPIDNAERLARYRQTGVIPPYVNEYLKKHYYRGNRNNAVYQLGRELFHLGLSLDQAEAFTRARMADLSVRKHDDVKKYVVDQLPTEELRRTLMSAFEINPLGGIHG